MKQYVPFMLKTYTNDPENDFEEEKNELLMFFYVLSFRAAKDEMLEITENFRWIEFLNSLMIDISSPDEITRKNVLSILINITFSCSHNALLEITNTALFHHIENWLSVQKPEALNCLQIVSNIALSSDYFALMILERPRLIFLIFKLIEEEKNNSLLLKEALSSIISILQCQDFNKVALPLIQNIDLFDVIYYKIFHSQNNECMLLIANIFELLFSIGENYARDEMGAKNLFKERVLESFDLANRLESGQKHKNNEVNQKFYRLINFYFAEE